MYRSSSKVFQFSSSFLVRLFLAPTHHSASTTRFGAARAHMLVVVIVWTRDHISSPLSTGVGRHASHGRRHYMWYSWRRSPRSRPMQPCPHPCVGSRNTDIIPCRLPNHHRPGSAATMHHFLWSLKLPRSFVDDIAHSSTIDVATLLCRQCCRGHVPLIHPRSFVNDVSNYLQWMLVFPPRSYIIFYYKKLNNITLKS